MSNPATIPAKDLVLGEVWDLPYVLEWGGVPLDLTPTEVSVVLKIRNRRKGATTLSRTKGATDETAWITDGTDGGIRFIAPPDVQTDLDQGLAIVDMVYADSRPNPVVKRLQATGIFTIYAPGTGTL